MIDLCTWIRAISFIKHPDIPWTARIQGSICVLIFTVLIQIIQSVQRIVISRQCGVTVIIDSDSIFFYRIDPPLYFINRGCLVNIVDALGILVIVISCDVCEYACYCCHFLCDVEFL